MATLKLGNWIVYGRDLKKIRSLYKKTQKELAEFFNYKNYQRIQEMESQPAKPVPKSVVLKILTGSAWIGDIADKASLKSLSKFMGPFPLHKTKNGGMFIK